MQEFYIFYSTQWLFLGSSNHYAEKNVALSIFWPFVEADTFSLSIKNDFWHERAEVIIFLESLVFKNILKIYPLFVGYQKWKYHNIKSLFRVWLSGSYSNEFLKLRKPKKFSMTKDLKWAKICKKTTKESILSTLWSNGQ